MKKKKRKLTEAQKEKVKDGVYILNEMIMKILQLGVTRDGYIIFNNKYKLHVKNHPVKLFNIGDGDIPFRPVLNTNMMGVLFKNHFSRIMEDEGRELKEIIVGPGVERVDKIYLKIIEAGYEDLPVITKEYYTETLRYIDAMCQLVEVEPSINLEELDLLLHGG